MKKNRIRILARLLAASGALILAASGIASGLGGSAAAALPAGDASAVTASRTISANVAGGYACDSTEWHFVITQTSDAQAPATITVTWANGATTQVLLGGVTGGTAHYTTSANLGSSVTSATATIADDWTGTFQLSHGPCAASSTPSASPAASASPIASPTAPTATLTPAVTTGEIPYGTVLSAGTTFTTGAGLGVQSLPSTSTQDVDEAPIWALVLSLVPITALALFFRSRARESITNAV